MDNREWETFITVVEEGNMTKAAEKLFISQPALSYRIRQMEAALGNALLLRTAEGIILTHKVKYIMTTVNAWYKSKKN